MLSHENLGNSMVENGTSLHPKRPAAVSLIPAATVRTRSRHQQLTVPFLIVLLKMSSRHHEYKYCSYSHTKKAIQIKQLNTKIR